MNASFSSERIYLIGYMGSGKSTVGKMLAERLGFEHMDTDEAIAQLLGQPIPEIFQEQGEAKFRTEEKKFLEFVTELDKVVISTGGGMSATALNLDKMLHSGITIYLECEIGVLAARIAGGSKRPLHKDISKEELENGITTRLAERRPFYREAHLSVPNNGRVETAVERIMGLLKGLGSI